MTKITFLKSIYKPTEVEIITLNQALVRIMKGESALKVEKYRKTGEEKIKHNLPAMLFNGEFSAAYDKELIKGSGVAILDFDDVGQIKELQDNLGKIDYIICSWISPSGRGIKALARIPVVETGRQYTSHFLALLEDLKASGLDVSDSKSAHDVSRKCFESFDWGLRAYRKFAEAKIFTGTVKLESKSVHLQADAEERISRDEKLYRQALSMLGGQRTFFVEGNRNNFIYKLAAICCNYGAKESGIMGLIQEDFGNDFTYKEVVSAVSSAFKAEKYTKWEFPFIRVGDNYFEVKNFNLIPRKRQTLVDKYGGPFLRKLPDYEDMTLVPNNTESWQDVVGNKYNLYTPFAHTPSKGSFATIEKLMRHVFGGQYELGLDYVQLLYLRPKQLLPVLCLVSRENQTGKSTFLEFLDMMFVNNVSIMSVEEFERQFNGFYATKLVIALDESETSDKKKVTNKIKQLSTQRHVFIENKFQSVIRLPFYGKIVMASNNEKSFAFINKEDIRYWVRKLGVIEEFDEKFHDKLENEIPAFCHYLRTRNMAVEESQSRMWFSAEQLVTDELLGAMNYNRPQIIVDLEEYLEECFYGSEDLHEIRMSAKNIKDRVFYGKNGQMQNSKRIAEVVRQEWRYDLKYGRFKSFAGISKGVVMLRDDVGWYFTFKRALHVSASEPARKV